MDSNYLTVENGGEHVDLRIELAMAEDVVSQYFDDEYLVQAKLPCHSSIDVDPKLVCELLRISSVVHTTP